MSEISELMSTDPLKLTKEDRAPIIAYLRENRVRFLATGKAKEPKKELPAGGIDFASLKITPINE